MFGTQSFAYDSFKMEAIKNCKDNFWSQMDESEKHLENFVKKLKELNLTQCPHLILDCFDHFLLHFGSHTKKSIILKTYEAIFGFGGQKTLRMIHYINRRGLDSD